MFGPYWNIVRVFGYHIYGVLTSNRQIYSVRRRFTTNILPGLYSLSYIDRLKMLNVKSLEVRRLYFDLILTYKIIFHLNDLDVDAFFTFHRSYCTRGHISYSCVYSRRFSINNFK